jgi:hypothetical protein
MTRRNGGLKKWLTEKYLPMWAKETVLRDNRNLRSENQMLRQKLGELEHYIQGVHLGLRGRRKE